MENSSKLIKLNFAEEIFKYFLIGTCCTLPFAMVIATITRVWILAWGYIAIWNLICIVTTIQRLLLSKTEVEKSPKNNKLNFTKKKVNLRDLTQILIQYWIPILLVIASFTLVNMASMANIVTVTYEVGTLVGSLAAIGLLGNIYIQLYGCFGTGGPRAILPFIWIAIIGILPFTFNSNIVAAFFFSSPLLILYLRSSYYSWQDKKSNMSNYLIREKLLFKIFPEEYINDRDNKQKRWQKQGFITSEIKIKTFFFDLGTLRGLFICKIQNIRHNKNRAE